MPTEQESHKCSEAYVSPTSAYICMIYFDFCSGKQMKWMKTSYVLLVLIPVLHATTTSTSLPDREYKTMEELGERILEALSNQLSIVLFMRRKHLRFGAFI